MDSLRVGVIGFGYIGRLHARAWGNISGATVTAVADPDGAPCGEVPHRARVFEDYRALLDEKLLGYEMTVFAMVHLRSQADADLKAFEDFVRDLRVVASELHGDRE